MKLDELISVMHPRLAEEFNRELGEIREAGRKEGLSKANAILERARADAHKAGRSKGYRQALADANEAIGLWKETHPCSDPLSYTVARRHMEAKYAERTQSPEEAEKEDLSMAEMATKIIVDNAVEAEHEAMVADAIQACHGWVYGDKGALGVPLNRFVRSKMEDAYRRRTNPKSDKVTVRMETDFYRQMVVARSPWLAHMELVVDPPGESETEKE